VHLSIIDQQRPAGLPAADHAADHAAVGSRTLLTSELLCESVDLRAGERVLDVACGSGNAALAAARRCCRVVGVDGRPALLERARRRAEAEGLEVTFLDGDTDGLPFPDGTFDVVLSACADLLVPDPPDPTAAELLRVCRPGGRIGMVVWSQGGYVGELFAAIGRQLPWGARHGCGSCSGRRWRSPPRGAACCGASLRPGTRSSSSRASTARPPGRFRRWGRTVAPP
jgi:SAM-dependent methyltransferase